MTNTCRENVICVKSSNEPHPDNNRPCFVFDLCGGGSVYAEIEDLNIESSLPACNDQAILAVLVPGLLAPDLLFCWKCCTCDSTY